MTADRARNQRIIVADDDEDVVELVSRHLTLAGFTVVAVHDGPQAVAAARREVPALMVLDLMLPGMSGLEVCKTLKTNDATARLPIMMLTARAEEIDRVLGFELGADDYVTKPFSPRELVLRIQAVLRRVGEAAEIEGASPVLQVGDILLDRRRYTVHVKGESVDLTSTEFKLLAMLMERLGRVQSRDALLNDIWAREASIDTRTVDTHMRRLREKLGSAAKYIQTVRGFGYRINKATA